MTKEKVKELQEDMTGKWTQEWNRIKKDLKRLET